MPKNYFKFKQFIINQENSSMKVGTDGVLLGTWTKTNNAKNILDIGTGTALIALMLAQKSDAEIVAIEIDKNSYLQSLSNINESRWANRISAKHISLQNFVAQTQRKFDLIVCNPPYFSNIQLNLSRDARIEASQMIRHGLLMMEGLSIRRETAKQEQQSPMEA